MPMLTTLRIGLPVCPVHSPARTRSAKPLIRSQDLVDLLDDVDAVDDQRAVARHPQRHVQDRAVLGDVDLLAGEHRVAALGAPRAPGPARPSSIIVSSVTRFLEKSRCRPAPSATSRSPRSGSAAKRSRRWASRTSREVALQRPQAGLRAGGGARRSPRRHPPALAGLDRLQQLAPGLDEGSPCPPPGGARRARRRRSRPPRTRARTCSASPPSAGIRSPTAPWSAKATSVFSGIVLTVKGEAQRLDVEDVGGAGVLGPGARPEQPLGAGALVEQALPAVGVEQLAVGAVGAAADRDRRAGCAARREPRPRRRRPSG